MILQYNVKKREGMKLAKTFGKNYIPKMIVVFAGLLIGRAGNSQISRDF